jgi:hypothetical protein
MSASYCLFGLTGCARSHASSSERPRSMPTLWPDPFCEGAHSAGNSDSIYFRSESHFNFRYLEGKVTTLWKELTTLWKNDRSMIGEKAGESCLDALPRSGNFGSRSGLRGGAFPIGKCSRGRGGRGSGARQPGVAQGKISKKPAKNPC